MNHQPCDACGYVIQHDEECPCCAREIMEAQLAALETKLTNLRTAAEHQYDENAGDDAEANADFWAAIEASR